MERCKKWPDLRQKNRQAALYGRYNRAFHSFPGTVRGGDVDFLLAGCYNVLPPDPCITLPYSTTYRINLYPLVFCTGDGVEQPASTISAIAGKKAFIIIKLPSGLQVSLIIYIGIVADILRISLAHKSCSDKTQIIPVRQLNDLSVRLFLTRYSRQTCQQLKIYWIDNLRGIACLMVVMIHTTTWYVTNAHSVSPVTWDIANALLILPLSCQRAAIFHDIRLSLFWRTQRPAAPFLAYRLMPDFL